LDIQTSGGKFYINHPPELMRILYGEGGKCGLMDKLLRPLTRADAYQAVPGRYG
jgi:hypothetical protein